MPRGSVGRLSGPNGKCGACRHPERGRLDYLLATGASHPALAKKFGLTKDSVWRHNKAHVSDDYRRSVKIGPFESEDHLRKLCAEAEVSVLDRLNAIYSGLSARWLVAFEAGDDAGLGMLSGRMMDNLTLQARLTKELLPPGAHGPLTTNNFYLSSEYLTVMRVAEVTLRPFPEARDAFVRGLRDLDAGGLTPMPMLEASRGGGIDRVAQLDG
jgi:hypothetical protein